MPNILYSVVLQYVDRSEDLGIKIHRDVTYLAYIPALGHRFVKNGKKYRVEEVVYDLDAREICITLEEI